MPKLASIKGCRWPSFEQSRRRPDALGLLGTDRRSRNRSGTFGWSSKHRSALPGRQWFVRMDELAQSPWMRDQPQVKIFQTAMPRAISIGWEKKRDWPVGRQLWWGHQNSHLEPNLRISQAMRSAEREVDSMDEAKNGRVRATRVSNTQRRCVVVGTHVCILDEDRGLKRRSRVWDSFDRRRLGYWFSSALWPHSTLGWPTRRQCWVLLSTAP